VETQIMCMYVCMYVYYTMLLVFSDPLCSSRGNLKNVCVCILYVHSGVHS